METLHFAYPLISGWAFENCLFCYYDFFANKSDNLHKTDKFLERHNLQKLIKKRKTQ